MRSLLDFFFPPLCLSCKEKCNTKIFCKDCWLLCELLDPLFRCRHCFAELEDQENLCIKCRRHRELSIPHAYLFDPQSPAYQFDLEMIQGLASFAILQWIQLEWPMPDAIIPMPGAAPIAFSFAKLLDRPFIQALSPACEYREGRLEEGQILLLFDIASPLFQLEKAAYPLAEALPQKIYGLSLFCER